MCYPLLLLVVPLNEEEFKMMQAISVVLLTSATLGCKLGHLHSFNNLPLLQTPPFKDLSASQCWQTRTSTMDYSKKKRKVTSVSQCFLFHLFVPCCAYCMPQWMMPDLPTNELILFNDSISIDSQNSHKQISNWNE